MITSVCCVYSASMNDFGFLKPSKEGSDIRYFYENDRYINNGNEIYADDDKLYLNGSEIADLKDFFRIIADDQDIFIITRKTIFKLNGDKLESIMTFNEAINDLVYEKGKFHVSLKKNIMNGIKFTHVTVSDNRSIRKVDTAVLNLKNTKYQEYLKNERFVYKSPENNSSKDNY